MIPTIISVSVLQSIGGALGLGRSLPELAAPKAVQVQVVQKVVEVGQGLLFWRFKGGFKVSLGTVERYRISYGTDFQTGADLQTGADFQTGEVPQPMIGLHGAPLRRRLRQGRGFSFFPYRKKRISGQGWGYRPSI